MASGVFIKVDGLKELQKKFKDIPQKVLEEVDGAMAVAALDYESRAVGSVPVDTGRLKGGISYKKIKDLHYEVVSPVEYSAYVEWGTRSNVQVPADLESYAIQFKRSDGSGGGMRPQPFFFIHRGIVYKQLKQDIRQAIKEALK